MTSRSGPCIAAKAARSCPLWVISVEDNWRDPAAYVRFISKSGHRLGSFPPPTLSECCHCGLATLSIAVRGSAILVVPEG
jgi:hypothetical protein